MTETATLMIADIQEPKHGTNKKGAPWTRYAFKDGNGDDYSTFQKSAFDPAHELKGQKAKVTYDVDGEFKNIVSIEAADPDSVIAARAPDGTADWDLIGLRKTRCVLWEAMLPIAMQAGIGGFTKAMNGEYDSGQLGGFVARFGKALRQIAEADIFLEDPVENADDWIPFLKLKKKPQGEDVPV